jgi:rubrerythrin
MSIARINPDLVDAFCTTCKADVMVGPSLTCPTCGNEVEPTSLAVMPKRVVVEQPKQATGRAAVLPRIRAAVQLDGALDATVSALEAEVEAAQAAYEAAKVRYRLARQALADARSLRALVKVADGAAKTERPKPVAKSAEGGSRWARDHDVCRDCGTTEHKHAARGRCTSCDAKWRQNGKPQ